MFKVTHVVRDKDEYVSRQSGFREYASNLCYPASSLDYHPAIKRGTNSEV